MPLSWVRKGTTRRIRPSHNQISVLRVRNRDSRAGAFSNKEKL
jgi:hypothetical protein